MSQIKSTIIWATCRSEMSKGTLPEDICALFFTQLETSFPACDIRAINLLLNKEAAGLQVALVVQRSSPSNLEARLDWSTDTETWSKGVVQGVAMADRHLDAAMLSEFMNDLIKRSAAPISC